MGQLIGAEVRLSMPQTVGTRRLCINKYCKRPSGEKALFKAQKITNPLYISWGSLIDSDCVVLIDRALAATEVCCGYK